MLSTNLSKLAYHSKLMGEKAKRKIVIIHKMKDYYRLILLSYMIKLKAEHKGNVDSDVKRIENFVNHIVDNNSSAILKTYFLMKENRAIYYSKMRDKIANVYKTLASANRSVTHMAYEALIRFKEYDILQEAKQNIIINHLLNKKYNSLQKYFKNKDTTKKVLIAEIKITVSEKIRQTINN